MFLPAWLLVGLGGFLGFILRYGASGLLQRLAPDGDPFPLGTFAVNVLGSLAIGPLGGFTTFSTFSFETLQLFRAGHWGLVLMNTAGQLSLGLAAVWLGWLLGRWSTA